MLEIWTESDLDNFMRGSTAARPTGFELDSHLAPDRFAELTKAETLKALCEAFKFFVLKFAKPERPKGEAWSRLNHIPGQPAGVPHVDDLTSVLYSPYGRNRGTWIFEDLGILRGYYDNVRRHFKHHKHFEPTPQKAQECLQYLERFEKGEINGQFFYETTNELDLHLSCNRRVDPNLWHHVVQTSIDGYQGGKQLIPQSPGTLIGIQKGEAHSREMRGPSEFNYKGRQIYTYDDKLLDK